MEGQRAPGSSSLAPFTRLLISVAGGVVVLAGMRAARSVIGPVLIALLITIAWSPGAQWLRRRGWHPTVSALTGIVVGVGLLALLVGLVWTSLTQLQENLPGYQARLETLRDASAELLSRLPFDTSRFLSSDALQPGTLVGRALALIRGLTATAGNLGILILIMAFMMIEAVRYPQKLYEATGLGGSDDEPATAGLTQFVHGMRSYVVINTVFGLAAAILNTALLLALGVDLAVLWGVVSFLLSFLPNVGFALALIPPALLALLQFGLVRAVIVLAGFTVINFLVDNVVKPRFVGESLDLSPAVVVLSLVFWGWLLGGVGALLAVPLSIACKVLFESYDEVRWIGRLMSDAGGRKSQPPP